MANQQQPSRPWFRLPSIARPVIDPPPAPAPAAPVARPALRPVNQTQDPILAGPTSQTAAVPRSPPRPGGGATSVPTSPVIKPTAPSSSLPTSPAVQTTAPAAPAVTTSSVPSSPRPKVSPPTSSLPTSPAARTTTPAAPSPPRPRVSAPTSSLPPSPVAPKPALSSSSVANSPMPKPVSTTFPAPTTSPKTAPTVNPSAISPIPMSVTTNTAAVAGAARPSPPATTVKPTTFQTTPPDSPKPKPTAPPPSPLILPPAKIKPDAEIPLEAEQKRVLVQKTISSDQNKPKPRIINGGQPEKDFGDSLKPGIGNSGKKLETPKDHITQVKEKSHHNHKKMSSESENGGMRVITIAGENKGAYMEVIRSPNKKNHVFEGISHNLQKNSGSSSSSSSSSSEEEGGRHKKKMENSQKGKTMSSAFMSTFMNSNVQGVNNSIVYNSSCSHHDPGVHLALSRKPATGAGKDHRSNAN